jgi:hypothetical protein
VKLFMILVKTEEMPFTIVEKVFVVVDSVFVFMKLVVTVAALPFTVLVREMLLVVVAIDKLFVVFVAIRDIVEGERFVAFRFVIVALLVVLFVAIRLVAVKLVNIAEMALSVVANRLVKKPLVVVELVMVALADTSDPVVVSPVVLVVLAFVVLAFTIFELRRFVFITFAAVVPSKLKLVNPLIVVVETIPSTMLVIKLVVDEKDRVFVVVAVIRDDREVVEITPFMLVVMIPVEVAKVTELFDITDDVATTPLTVVVRVLPDSVVVREFIILANSVVTPLTIEVRVLVVVDKEFVFMIVVVPIDPAIFEVNTFEVLDSEFVAFKFVTERLVAVAFVALRLFTDIELNIGLFVKE